MCTQIDCTTSCANNSNGGSTDVTVPDKDNDINIDVGIDTEWGDPIIPPPVEIG